MSDPVPLLYTAFDGNELFANGQLEAVILKVKRRIEKNRDSQVLIFNDSTGQTMDFDLSGSEKEVLRRLEVFLTPNQEPFSRGPGRPKLGVVAREISLLPRHWEWLATQSGGASATLRRLVESAKKDSMTKSQVRLSQERTYKFMSVIAGNLPCYEEALRALYKKDEEQLKKQIEDWPPDIRDHVRKLAKPVFSPAGLG